MHVTEKSNNEQLELVIAATGVGVWDWKIRTGDVLCNEHWANMIGYSLEELHPIKFDTWLEHLHPEDLPKSNKILEKHFNREIELYEVEIRMKHKQGQYIWVLSKGKTIEWYEDGLPKRMIGTHLDITERKINEQTLITTSQLLDESQKIAKVGGWQLDLISNDLFWTAETYRIHEASPETFNPNVDVGVSLFLPESRQIIMEALDDAINFGKSYDLELETHTTKGKLIDIRTTCIATIHDGKPIKLTGIFQDISEQKKIQRKLEKSNRDLENVNDILTRGANYDALTGLPNRNLLADRMEQALAYNKRNKSSLAIVFIDLDGFKEVNDTYGHSIGDDLLCCITEELKKTMRECDTLARIGGDEFVMILDELESSEQCSIILTRVLESVSNTSFIKNKPIQVSASIGVTIYPQDNSNSDQLLRHADQAMYIAKKSGKNCFHIFDVAKDVAEKHQHEEVTNIRIALISNEFELYYQPKINIKTNEVIGLEALIRWRHPELGTLPPLTFLPIIEQDILNVEVGEWVIKAALTQLSVWSAKGINLPVSVNVSPLHLQQPNFVERLKQILKKFPKFKAGSIEFEILETSALREIEQVTKVIHECHDLGITFSIDDFGTGYSSLAYLKRLPTDCLKIDKSFIKDMLDDPDDKSIVLGIISLAKAFNRSVIAEGVETTAHGEHLLLLGCHLAQGFGIARPMPSYEFPLWFKEWQIENVWQYLSDTNTL
ncbi:MAG: EAL domain-containing protein [Colwellia sp.]|nr:EAL domain-containing protein [Colwellia sp.]